MRAEYKGGVVRPQVLCHAHKHGRRIQTLITSPSVQHIQCFASGCFRLHFYGTTWSQQPTKSHKHASVISKSHNNMALSVYSDILSSKIKSIIIIILLVRKQTVIIM